MATDNMVTDTPKPLVTPMATADVLLGYIEELLPQLTEKHYKLVDICLALKGFLKAEKRKQHRPPAKRDRAAYMRRYRAFKKVK